MGTRGHEGERLEGVGAAEPVGEVEAGRAEVHRRPGEHAAELLGGQRGRALDQERGDARDVRGRRGRAAERQEEEAQLPGLGGHTVDAREHGHGAHLGKREADGARPLRAVDLGLGRSRGVHGSDRQRLDEAVVAAKLSLGVTYCNPGSEEQSRSAK